MSDVFISYSRLDQEAAYKLYEALQLSKHPADPSTTIKCWIDKDDIEYSVMWWERICKGIQDASNFAIIMSDNYLASEVCNEEYVYAVSLGKPIIPILISPISKDGYQRKQRARQTERGDWKRNQFELADENYKKLSDINYVPALSLDFAALTNAVVESIFQDIEYKDGLRKWSNRTRDWEKRQHHQRSLLSGNDIDEAEIWRDSAAEKQLPLDGKLVEYIAKSRLNQRRNQRYIRLGVTTALIAVSILAVIAFALFGQSETNLELANVNGTAAAEQALTAIANANLAATNEAVAIEERDRAVTSGYVSEANALLANDGGNAETAALLSLRAVQTGLIPRAEEVLQRSLDRIRTDRVIPSLGTYGFTGDWIPGQAQPILITYIPNEGLARINPDTGVIEVRFMDSSSGIAVDGFLDTFSDDGNLFLARYGVMSFGSSSLAAVEESEARLWNTETGSLVQAFKYPGNIISVALNASGTRAATGTTDGRVIIWDVASGDIVYSVFLTNPISAISFSPVDQHAFFGLGNNSGVLWDIERQERVLTFEDAQGSFYARFSPDGNSLFTISPDDNSVEQWDTTTGNLIQSFSGHRGFVYQFELSRDGSQLLTSTYCDDSLDCSVRLWDTATGLQKDIFTGHDTAISTLGFGPNETYLGASYIEETNARIWRSGQQSANL